MCGIAGCIELAGGPPPSQEILDAQCRVLRHRGPDGHGTLIDVGDEVAVGLSHTRLAIIDLSDAGRQPMPNEDASLQLLTNGEIYNYRELRRELEAKGHQFRSRTDSEVILHLYEEEGPDCVARLNGMFALALWDKTRQSLLLARDRFGVKPLYVADQGERVAFGSEVKAILELPGFGANLDFEALSEHLSFMWCTGGRTFFKGIELLDPGTWLLISKGRRQRRRYHELRYDAAEPVAGDEAVTALRAAFERSVERQLVSDVPVGSYLSGGMDTGSITAVAARKLGRFHTFTTGFSTSAAEGAETYRDERPESWALSRLLDTEHHELEIDPTFFEPAIPRLTWHLEEPRVGISYQVMYTAEMVRKYVPVVLSGVGGDELFAGYPWRYQKILGVTDPTDFADRYYGAWIRFMNEDQKKGFFSDSVVAELGGFDTRATFDKVLAAAATEDPLHKALYFDFKTFLHGLFLVDDKLTMAHSVEGRVPFMDNDLLDLVTRIPSRQKMDAAGTAKVLLKQAMQGLLPAETIHRQKQGFTPPDATWYRGPLRPYIESIILSPRALQRDLFRPASLRTVLDEHFS
ncbi:MAG: asparagine synthase (glutamine-hydrolyzing), partial [Planctomycetota bacterium]